jgi:hypothetical protein
MSKYFDGKSLFLEPQVNQYGSHMVMTNVTKPSKRKYINIDTKFRDDYQFYETNSVANFNVTLPERITEVKNMIVCNAEIPMSFYNVSPELGNNYFKIIYNTASVMVEIPGGNYDAVGMINAINTSIQTKPSPYKNISVSIVNNHAVIDCSLGTLKIEFDINADGSLDKYNFKRKLGWLLGFRNISYTISPTASTVSENFADLTGLRYVYLVIDEFGKGNQNSFLGPLPSSLVKKNILAKIMFNKTTFPFGTVIPANNFNGYLLTDRRSYTGKIDIQKLNVQLVDDVGNPVNLNGLDFSFCLEVEHE